MSKAEKYFDELLSDGVVDSGNPMRALQVASAALPDDLKEQSWQKVMQKIDAAEENFNPSLAWRLLSVRFAIPIAGLVMLLIAQAVFFRPLWQLPEVTPVMLSMKKGSVNLATEGYSHSGKKPQVAKLGRGLKLWLRDVRNVRGSVAKDGSLQISLTKGDVIFKYDRTRTQRQLVITTPKGKFAVVGTEFLVRARKGGALLLVKKGKVLVDHRGDRLTIKKNQGWRSDGSGKVKVKKKSLRKLFKAAKKKKLKSATLNKLLNDRATPKAKTVTIYLKNGQKLRGRLVSSNKRRLRIKTGVAGTFDVARKDIKKIK